jgi:beta-glucosidase
LAATWDKAVIHDVCKVLIAEARSKSVDVLLGPTGMLTHNEVGNRAANDICQSAFLGRPWAGATSKRTAKTLF